MSPITILLLVVAILPGAPGRRLKLRDAPTTRQQQLPWSQRQQNKGRATVFGEHVSSKGTTCHGQKCDRRSSSRRELFKYGVSYPVNLIRDPRCDPYEMCKCRLGNYEKDTQCTATSCVFSPLAPAYCKFASPECKWRKHGKVEWHHCEFANTKSTDFYPGQNLFVALRKKQEHEVQMHKFGARVFTDIDDTIICGGVPLDSKCNDAGTKDGGIFPGVVAFYYALAKGTLTTLPKGKKLRKPLPITARPGELKLILGMDKSIASMLGSGKAIKEAFQQEGPKEWKLDTSNAKYGSIRHLLDNMAIVGHRGTDATQYDQVAYRKFSAYKHMYDKQYKKMGVAGSFFVGDNTQGDLVAAQMMLSYGTKPGLRAAFIHDVYNLCYKECREEWKKYGIFVFSHYAQAACIAKDEGFITEPDKTHVCKEAEGLTCSAAYSFRVRDVGMLSPRHMLNL